MHPAAQVQGDRLVSDALPPKLPHGYDAPEEPGCPRRHRVPGREPRLEESRSRMKATSIPKHEGDPVMSEYTPTTDTSLRSRLPVNVAQVRQISPFRYPGGKTWLVPVAREWLQMIGRPKVLLEPFAGGAHTGLTAAAARLAEHVVR